MFVQIIEGKVTDGALLARQMERWRTEVKPHWSGYLGYTGGVTPDGTFILALRTSDEAAMIANAELPQQQAWWSETVAAFDGEPAAQGSSDVNAFKEGDDAAGFVQMMQATVSDRARLEQLEETMNAEFVRLRPDVMGHITVWLPNGRMHVVDWFTSEAEARAGEQVEFPDEMKQRFGEWMGLLSDTRWYDLPEPMMDSP